MPTKDNLEMLGIEEMRKQGISEDIILAAVAQLANRGTADYHSKELIELQAEYTKAESAIYQKMSAIGTTDEERAELRKELTEWHIKLHIAAHPEANEEAHRYLAYLFEGFRKG